jgi:general secretion pathway protein H
MLASPFATNAPGMAALAASFRRGFRRPGPERGLTLVELLVTLTIVTLVTTAVLFGSGSIANSRMKGATTMVAGAIRIAYTRASATSRPNRLAFDLDGSRVALEETSDVMVLREGDTTGGAEAKTELERDAVEQAQRIVKGPQAPRATFHPVKALGFDEGDNQGRSLGKGVKFHKIETGHSPDGQTSGRAYLYFWPGGRTERAAIHITTEGANGPDDGLTVLVSPLTGRVHTVKGGKSIEPLRDDGTSSEREDTSF